MDYKLNIWIKNKLDGMKDVSGIERQSVKVVWENIRCKRGWKRR